MSGPPPALTLVVAGIGRMGRTHLSALSSLADPDLRVACAEPSAAARSWAARAGYPVYPTLAEALEDPSVQAVLIAAPTPLHAGLAHTALRAGCPVLCEKPGGLDPDLLLDLDNEASQYGVPIRLGYWHRFVPALQAARARVMAGELGEVLSVHSAQWDGSPPGDEFLGSSGGELIDMGVHEIDFAAWLLGEELTPCGASMLIQPGGRNAAAGIARSQHGAIVTVSAGRFLPDGDGCWIEVLGTRGAIFERWLWGAAGEELNLAAVREQDRRFLDLVRGGTGEGLATAGEGARSLRLALELTRLAGSGVAASGARRF